MQHTQSSRAYKDALKFIPGGVNSPVRALKSVGQPPFFIEKASGAFLYDIDGNRYLDFCLSWGVFILGHAHPAVQEAVLNALANGSSYGIPTLQETTLAKRVYNHFPSMEQVRFVNSGTEAVMSAIRVARGYTGRDLIVKFDGCYHGHADHLLVSAGSGVVSLQNSSSKGVPEGITRYTLSIPFNDKDAVWEVFELHGNDIAALIVEPVPANMGVILPEDGFLTFLREITSTYGSLLIFDEVITGFRLSDGGAQKRSGITPDLTTIGKIIGGGFPAAAFGGKREIMELLAPEGPVYQAGTLSGNPVAMAAGIETVKVLERPGFYDDLEKKSTAFYASIREIIKDKDIRLNTCGSMFTLFFSNKNVRNFEDAKQCNTQQFGEFFREMFNNGIYLSPSQFEASFISDVHTKEDLNKFLEILQSFIEKRENKIY